MKISAIAFIIFALHQKTTAKAVTISETLALVSEPISGSEKRQLELLPDELPVDITTVEDKQARVHLVKQSNIDFDKIKLTVLGSDLVERPQVTKRIVGYYQDRSHAAVIAVTAKRNGDRIVRTLEGTLVLHNKAYEIHPKILTSYSNNILEARSEQELENVHVLKEVDLHHYLNPDKYKHVIRNKEYKGEKANGINENHKRHVQADLATFHVEIKFLLDWTIYEHFMYEYDTHDTAVEATKYFFLHIFNGMNMAYRRIEETPQHNIKIILWLDEIIITKTFYESSFTYGAWENNQVQTKTFFDLIQNYRENKGYTWNKPDHLSVWTRNDMLYGNTAIYGVADLCGVCEDRFSTAINMEIGYFSWTTGAHELAHILGSEHDGHGYNFCFNEDRYLMTTEALNLTNTLNGLRFSDCSISQMRDCITGNSDYGSIANSYIYAWPRACVYESKCEHKEDITDIDVLPGQRFSLYSQCNHINSGWGHSKSKCPSKDICKSMRCLELSTDKCISHTPELKAAPGTKCDINDSNKICYAGECVSKSGVKSFSQDFQCSDEEEVPYGCFDKGSYCDGDLKSEPYKCFYEKSFYENCPASCHREGLYEVGFSPCKKYVLEIEPEITTPIKKDFPMYCVPEYAYPPEPYKESLQNICSFDLEVKIRCPVDSTKCVSPTQFCDLKSDCPNDADESSTFCQKLTAGAAGYIRKQNDPFKVALVHDCITSSDSSFKTYCKTAPTFCPLEFYAGINCPNNPAKCIPPHVACDGNNDCDAANDEVGDETMEFCMGLCSPGYVKCPGNKEMSCINTEYACDGVEDCKDSGDEEQLFCDELKRILTLSSNNDKDCPIGKVSCPKSRECIYEDYLCDTIVDCYDKSDEDWEFCVSLPQEQCSTDYVPCPDFKAKCILEVYLCDGIRDCFDGSDEKYCNTKAKYGSVPVVNATRLHYHRNGHQKKKRRSNLKSKIEQR